MVRSVAITISVAPQVKHCLDKIAATGLHGKNAAEVAKTLLGQKLNEIVDKGQLLDVNDLKIPNE